MEFLEIKFGIILVWSAIQNVTPFG